MTKNKSNIIAYEIIRETEKAILVTFGAAHRDGSVRHSGVHETWLPKSQIEAYEYKSHADSLEEIVIFIPGWLKRNIVAKIDSFPFDLSASTVKEGLEEGLARRIM